MANLLFRWNGISQYCLYSMPYAKTICPRTSEASQAFLVWIRHVLSIFCFYLHVDNFPSFLMMYRFEENRRYNHFHDLWRATFPASYVNTNLYPCILMLFEVAEYQFRYAWKFFKIAHTPFISSR